MTVGSVRGHAVGETTSLPLWHGPSFESLPDRRRWCKKNRHLKTRVLFKRLNAKLRGYYNYYGVHGNFVGLKQFYGGAMRILFKWLNRRRHRRSYDWIGFKEMLDHFKVEQPRIVGRPKTRRVAFTV
jgi:RNA-directed DNA polymerase